MQASAPAAKVRVEWIDYAKGICIFFVVMLHVNDHVQDRALATSWLDHVIAFARPFRMPDFFLIAGLFLANAIRRPWRRYLDSKVVHFLYFYLLWTTLRFGLYDLPHLVRQDGASAQEIVWMYVRRWIDPIGSLWFIHILPLFFVVTRLTRRVPPGWIWLGAATLHSLQIQTSWHVINQVVLRYVYFYSGYVLAPHVFRITSWARTHARGALGYLACWGVLNALLVTAGWAALPFVSLALGYAGALAVILVAVLLSKRSWARPVRYLGESSIVVYLGEFWVGLLVTRALAPLIGDLGALALISTPITVIGAILLWRVVLRTPASFLYVRPRWLRLAAAPRPQDPPSAAAEAPAAPALGEQAARP
ncbi:MAG TPA: acyltransferase family protein [Kofleriaceae bacterium]|nr:acyltransferase family protein [Kofleriaceae bacterium]